MRADVVPDTISPMFLSTPDRIAWERRRRRKREGCFAGSDTSGVTTAPTSEVLVGWEIGVCSVGVCWDGSVLLWGIECEE